MFGLISNGAAIAAVIFNPVLKNSFGLLCLSHSIANFGVLLVFTFWVAPMTVVQNEHNDTLLGKLFGQVNIMFWNVCVYSHLAISLNRLIAIALPYQATFLLTLKKTFIVVGIAWFLGFCHIIAYFWTDTCYVFYESSVWAWKFADTYCGYIISIYFDCYVSLTVLVAILVLDCSTFIKLRLTNKSTQQNSTTTTNEATQRKRRQTEVRFFWQTVCQNITFFYEQSNFYYIATLSTNLWYVFFTSTFAWEICHALDGFIVVLFHFRLSLMRRGEETVTHMIADTSGQHSVANRRSRQSTLNAACVRNAQTGMDASEFDLLRDIETQTTWNDVGLMTDFWTDMGNSP
ncbi:hypothetical protein Q1695_004992 [Nippostrongylus brasiliensis]|nr:hypothetical protein Q1695_004992 [Nippostrongylus brasiliensis]